MLTGLTAGRYVLMASIGGAPPGERASREPETGYLSLEVGNVDLTANTVQMSRGVRLRGRVVFDGQPVPNAKQLRMVVQTSRPGESSWRLIAGRPPFSPVKNDLTFELESLYRLPLIAGIYGLPDGWVLKAVRFEGRDVTFREVDFGVSTPKSRLEIVLTNRVASSLVRVVDDRGRALAGSRVVLVPADRSRWPGGLKIVESVSGSDGVLELGKVLPGDYLLAALPAADVDVLTRFPERLAVLAAVARPVTFKEGDEKIVVLTAAMLPDEGR